MAGISRGAAGEMLAARFFRDKGYAFLTSNYRCRWGEIDIIVTDRKYIAFVEVKTRSEDAIYTPREAVTLEKRRKIIRTASMFLKTHPQKNKQPRFDVVEVVTSKEDILKVLEINHILNAYEAGDLYAAF